MTTKSGQERAQVGSSEFDLQFETMAVQALEHKWWRRKVALYLVKVRRDFLNSDDQVTVSALERVIRLLRDVNPDRERRSQARRAG